MADPTRTSDRADFHESDQAESDGDLMNCGDCSRAIFYDYDEERYRHCDNPEKGCFLIKAEKRADTCSNGHAMILNNPVAVELWCPTCNEVKFE